MAGQLTQKFQLVMTEREHLFALANVLVNNIPPQLLADSQNPVTIGLGGSFQSGKKIIPDAFVSSLQDKKELPSVTGNVFSGSS
jgi:pantothenate kinase